MKVLEAPHKEVRGGWKIISEGTFLECVKALVDEECDAIFGPEGGVVIIDKISSSGLIYHVDRTKDEPNGIYFSANNFLGVWRCLKRKW